MPADSVKIKEETTMEKRSPDGARRGDGRSGRRIGRMQMAILLRTILPMLVMGIAIIAVALNRTEAALEKEVDRSLLSVATAVAAAYDSIYPGDYELRGTQYLSLYKGETDITEATAIIDSISRESGMQVTLFYQDARILTTLRDADGRRHVGTGSNLAIYAQMERAQAPLYYEVDIEAEKYYACYVPLFQRDGSFSGMVGVAYPSVSVRAQLASGVRPIWVITLLGLLIASYVSLRYTSAVTSAIGQIRAFLLRMVGGELGNELPESVTKRGDELGEAGAALARMQNAVRILVERDPLTTLYNRRYGNAKLKNLQLRAQKSGEPFAVAIGDIDFFKKVNDTYGHDAGDAILKHVAEELKSMMASRGSAVRWGGEEFLLMYENHTLGDAARAVEEFLERIRSTPVDYEGQSVRISMTMGLVPGDAATELQELIREADEKLYYGKQHGRDQLVVDRSQIKADTKQRTEDGGEVVMGFSEEFLDSANLMQLLTENVAKAAEQEAVTAEDAEEGTDDDNG